MGIGRKIKMVSSSLSMVVGLKAIAGGSQTCLLGDEVATIVKNTDIRFEKLKFLVACSETVATRHKNRGGFGSY